MSSITVKSTFDPVGRTCDEAAAAQQIADALRTGGGSPGGTTSPAFSVSCNGLFWSTGPCQAAARCAQPANNVELAVGVNPNVCTCDETDFHLRPARGDEFWGGDLGRCGVPTQTLTVEVEIAADGDLDGIPDEADNCPDTANPDQADADDDGVGDTCEPDGDQDGVIGDTDNCASTPNSDQQDSDDDGAGDACDADDDGDGVNDEADNCPLIANPDQGDFDRDGAGDACDADIDGDGVNDAADQCFGTASGEAVVLDPASEDAGCSIAQLCPCDNPNGWKNQGEYVRCVAHTSEDFVDRGLITEAEKDRIASQAGSSRCGHKR